MANKMQVITKFELLPNEIVIECFEYLNGSDIFYSFHHLNYRFDTLIQDIPLEINFEHVRKTIFDQFCIIILSNSEIKRQIHSLRLSNNDTCDQIQTFISLFSLHEFTSLRSLTLTGVDNDNLDKLKFMLPLLSKTFSIHLIDPDDELKGKLSIQQIRRFQTSRKTIWYLPLLKISSLTNLTLSDSTCRDISQLFGRLPMLKYLNVRQIDDVDFSTNDYTRFTDDRAVQLKQLIMIHFLERFENFEMLVKQIPNLKTLMISSCSREDITDARRWEDLITSSLPQLTVFKFKFNYKFWPVGKEIIFDKYEKFQTDFWREQHHWYTEFSYFSNQVIINTIPYMSNTADYNYLPKQTKTFDNITDLAVSLLNMREDYKHYLKTVTTLRLKTTNDNVLLGREDFESLKMIVNLSNLKHLDLKEIPKTDRSFLLLKILKEAPQLSSLEIAPSNLALMFSNDESRKYLKIMKKLSLWRYPTLFINDNVTEEFCEVFSNIEQLSCTIDDPRYLLILLNRLSKLLLMKIYLASFGSPIDLSSFKDAIRKSNALFHIACVQSGYARKLSYMTTLTIWMNNNII